VSGGPPEHAPAPPGADPDAESPPALCLHVHLPDGEPRRLLGLLGAPARLRVFAALVLGAETSDEVAERAALPVREALRELRELADGGLAERAGGGWAARPDALRNAAAAGAAPPDRHPMAGSRPDPAVARDFTRDGRIVALPAQRGPRLELLDHVARAFEPGIRYAEAEVEAVLRAFHADSATLRRTLVDEGFLDRDTTHYWRCGGTVAP
jgi:hypothetical protein